MTAKIYQMRPGLDMVFFGPGDFSQAISVPGRMDDPRITETRKRIAELAVKHKKFAGTVGGIGNFAALADMGYQFISVGADVIGLSQYCRDITDQLVDKQGNKPKSIYSE